jgi:proteasome assembly chaperone (PAC2) family protein
MSLVELRERPELRDPFLVVHLTGWTDAGMAGQTSAVFLRARWNARRLAAFDSDELIDYRARRPVVRLASGVIERVTWTPIELSVGNAGQRDAILLTGPEPDLRWHAFTEAVVQACRDLSVREVFGLGAFPAPSLHTDPVAVLGTSADPDLAARLETVRATVELNAGIQSVLEERLHQAGGSHPPAALALVHALARLAAVEVDTAELDAASKEHLEQVEQAVRERPQIAEFIDQIRALVEQGDDDERIPSGDEIAAELERFLSQQPPPDDEQG